MRGWLLGVLVVGCGSHGEDGTLVQPGPGVANIPGGLSPVHSPQARPISGGTLLVTRDGKSAVAADPDRDRVYLVDLASHAVSEVALQQGDEPGRLLEDAGGRLYVALRSGGAVVQFNRTAQILGRIPVCLAPRGLGHDAASGEVLVACQGGELASLSTEPFALRGKVQLDRDLRDVLVLNGKRYATRFRTAELLELDATGAVLSRNRPSDEIGSARMTSAVAWRTLPAPNGDVVMLHQLEQTDGVNITPAGYYGSGGCAPGIVHDSVSVMGPNGQVGRTQVPTMAGAADVALSSDGSEIAMVSASNNWGTRTSAALLVFSPPSSPISSSPCGPNDAVAVNVEGEPTAVAYDSTNRIVVQSREPATLQIVVGASVNATIALSAETRADTGLALFHMNVGFGVACSSCHPEGTDDGRVWNFPQLGPRRTQFVAGGVTKHAPFHWDGDLTDMRDLMNEVFVSRMGAPERPARRQIEAMAAWLDGVAAPPVTAPGDPAAIGRGAALFADDIVGCAGCHSGSQFTDNNLYDVGTGGVFSVPSLVGIGLHPPYLHDGCAPTLRDRFSGACGGGDLHGKTSHLSPAQIDDLVAYLETL